MERIPPQAKKPTPFTMSRPGKQPSRTPGPALRPSQVRVASPATVTPTGPAILVPREDVGEFVGDLLRYLFDKAVVSEPKGQEENKVKALADLAIGDLTAYNIRQKTIAEDLENMGISIKVIADSASEIAPKMDVFFAKYNVGWNGLDAYNWASGQVKAWGMFPVEDFNSTRRFCVDPGNDPVRMVFNLLRMFNGLSRDLGQF